MTPSRATTRSTLSTTYRPEPGAPAVRPSAPSGPATRVLALPAALAVALGAFAPAASLPALRWSFLGAGGVLLAWCVALLVQSRRSGRVLGIDVALRPQHWLQACAHSAVIGWWAWYTPLVRSLLPFFLVQIVFAYAVDGLLTWSRRDRWALGFGPFPIIFSTNLFLIFRPEQFHWQFVMIALGFAAKELIRWTRDGKSTHIFNPSSFPLAVFSVVLLATGSTNLTYGPAIVNTQFDTPHIYLVIFLVTIPAQILFGVSRMTLAAVVTMYAVSEAYFLATGTYLFYDAHIPAAVFLGMHLLFTDPSTSPRTELGRIVFGVMYALGTTALFIVLESQGMPTFYDKLLPVPLMNLMVRGIDRLARTRPLAALDPARLLRALTPIQANAAITALWVVTFAALSASRAVGDRHPGQYLPFWHQACATGNLRACRYTAQLTFVHCQQGSGWACNEVGLLNRRVGREAEREFARSCALGFAPGCENATRPTANVATLTSGRPARRDLPILLAGTKPPLQERAPERLAALACDEGWPGACERGWVQ